MTTPTPEPSTDAPPLDLDALRPTIRHGMDSVQARVRGVAEIAEALLAEVERLRDLVEEASREKFRAAAGARGEVESPAWIEPVIRRYFDMEDPWDCQTAFEIIGELKIAAKAAGGSRLSPAADPRRVAVLVLAAGYLATVVAANWAVATYGAVPVGFGLLAPAGVYVAGLAFTLRDLLHSAAGRWAVPVVLASIAGGSGLSFAVATPRLALASAAAFGLSELADFFVYAPLHRRRWLTAVTVSNLVGLCVDSALFLWLAFGSLTFLPGQIVGKAWMTVLAVALLALGRSLHRKATA